MSFAPVASIHVDIVRTPHGVEAVGWAAPASGRLPCALHLHAGSTLLAVGRATRYSPEAAAQDVRFGWCGFQVGDLSVAAALADEVRLVCATDGSVKASWPAAAIVERDPPAARPALTIPQFRSVLARVAGCTDVATILPFADHMQRRQGDTAAITAAYRWILERTPAPDEAKDFSESLDSQNFLLSALTGLVDSDEYLARNRTLGGPFQGGFPFGLSVFDHP